MNRLLIILTSLLILVPSLYGQASYTTVTGTLTDSSSQVWSNATVIATLRPAPNNPALPLNNGLPITDTPQTVITDNSGSFTLILDNTDHIKPSGALWNFVIYPNATVSNGNVINLPITGASVDLSGVLSSIISNPNVFGTPVINRGYKDSEVSSGTGGLYWNTTTNLLKGCIFSFPSCTWVNIGGNGTLTSVNATSPIVVTPNPIVNTGTISLSTSCVNQVWEWNGASWTCASPSGVTSITANAPIIATPNPITGIGTLGCTDCVTFSGNGITGTGASPQVALWSGAHTQIGDAGLTYSGNRLSIGVNGFASGALSLCPAGGASCGTIIPQTSGGANSFKLPDGSIAGTFAIAASLPLVLDSTTGNMTCPTCQQQASFNAPQRVTLGGDTTTSGTPNTQLTVVSETVTFPATTGTYRALVSYNVWATTGGNVCNAEAVDTTHNIGFAPSGQNPNALGFAGFTGSELSSQTYTASSTANFSLVIVCNGASIPVTVSDYVNAALSPSVSTHLSVTPVLSN